MEKINLNLIIEVLNIYMFINYICPYERIQRRACTLKSSLLTVNTTYNIMQLLHNIIFPIHGSTTLE